MYFILVLVGSPLFRFARQTPTFFNSRMLYAGGFLYSPNHLRFADALHWRHSLYLRPVFPQTPFVPCSLHSLISFLPIFPTIGRTDIIRFASALGWGCAPWFLYSQNSYRPLFTLLAITQFCSFSEKTHSLCERFTQVASPLLPILSVAPKMQLGGGVRPWNCVYRLCYFKKFNFTFMNQWYK